MTLLRLGTIVASLISMPALAWSQELTVEQARAHADALIQRSGVGASFENITIDSQPTVRHIPSGMTCEFVGADDRDVIRSYNTNGEDSSSGNDVSCNTWIGRSYVSVFATKYPQGYPSEELFGEAIGQIKANWPQAVEMAGPFEIMTLDGQPLPLVAVFEVELDGQPRRSVLLHRNIGAWSFKARATGPGTDMTVVEVGSMQFSLSLPRAREAIADDTNED